MSRGILAVDIPFSSEEDIRVEPPAFPSSRELMMIQSSHDTAMAGSSSGSRASHELVWPCPGEPRKARFILCDEEVMRLNTCSEKGLSMESDLAQTKAKLKEALERVELIHQAVSVDLPCVTEVSLLCF